MKVVILATGPSMSAAVAHAQVGRIVVAVNDAYRLAPWADALAAQDAAWWAANPDARQFMGRKFSSSRLDGVECLPIGTEKSSGVLALHAAVLLGATDIELHGFDMRGSHYFGPHTKPKLENTSADRFEVFQHQFASWRDANPHIHVVNCTPNSALRAFPHG